MPNQCSKSAASRLGGTAPTPVGTPRRSAQHQLLMLGRIAHALAFGFAITLNVPLGPRQPADA
eukprot:6258127-Prymnesium_polylepis.1